jgi:NAD(P)H-nitrite reductase large subunit
MSEAVRYLIIGGGIAGTTAAETIRSHDPQGTIAIISDEPYPLYSRIMLSKPNFFLGRIPFESIWLKNDAWYAAKRITMLGGVRAISLDPSRKTVALSNGETISYEKLLLATGGAARPWDVPGATKRGVYSLRTLDDAKAIIAAVKTAKRSIAVGGGFVSFEMCEMMRLAGLEVTLLLREPFYWGLLLDEPSGRMIEAALERGGVKIRREVEVGEVLGDETVTGVRLKSGEDLPCEMIIVGIGIVSSLDWLRSSGIAVGRGILANEYLETNVPDVWTAGDVAEFNDLILRERVQLGNWVNAQMQGRIAGKNMVASAGVTSVSREPFKMVSFYTTSGFGITIAFVGDVRPLPDRHIVVRDARPQNSYGRIILSSRKIIGATLINRTNELGALTKLIEHDVNVSGKEPQLADPSFDLTTLLPPKR